MKNITIKDETHKKLKKIADQQNISMSNFLDHSVDYFSKTKVNPKTDVLSIKEEIIRLEKRVSQIIGFIKTLEQESFLPLYQEMKKTDIRINNLVNTVNELTMNLLEETKRHNNLIAVEIANVKSQNSKIEKDVNNTLGNILNAVKESNKGFLKTLEQIESANQQSALDMLILMSATKDQKQAVAKKYGFELEKGLFK